MTISYGKAAKSIQEKQAQIFSRDLSLAGVNILSAFIRWEKKNKKAHKERFLNNNTKKSIKIEVQNIRER